MNLHIYVPRLDEQALWLIFDVFSLKVKRGIRMKEFTYVITDEVGIHARPAGALAKLVKEGASRVTINAHDKSAEATKLMAVMGMGVKKGTKVHVIVEGADEEQMAGKIEQFFKENL